MVGVLTAYGRGGSESVSSLANTSGSWVLVAFPALRPRTGHRDGVRALASLLAGYVLGAGIRGFPSSTALMVFWGLAAVLAGPPLGLSAHWVRAGRPGLAALGAGVPAGVLIGEGVYGLRVISDTTFRRSGGPRCLEVLLLCVVAAIRLRHPRL